MDRVRALTIKTRVAGVLSLVGAGDRSVVIAELYYLNEKKGRPLDFQTKYARLAAGERWITLQVKVDPSRLLTT